MRFKLSYFLGWLLYSCLFIIVLFLAILFFRIHNSDNSCEPIYNYQACSYLEENRSIDFVYYMASSSAYKLFSDNQILNYTYMENNTLYVGYNKRYQSSGNLYRVEWLFINNTDKIYLRVKKI